MTASPIPPLHRVLVIGTTGVGKTTLAHLLASELKQPFSALSAINAGVKDVRDVIEGDASPDGKGVLSIARGISGTRACAFNGPCGDMRSAESEKLFRRRGCDLKIATVKKRGERRR